jgi:hypothetical protein
VDVGDDQCTVWYAWGQDQFLVIPAAFDFSLMALED